MESDSNTRGPSTLKHSSIQSKAFATMWDTALRDGEKEETRLLQQHLLLLQKPQSQHGLLEVKTTPIFTMPILKHAERLDLKGTTEAIPQYGLLGGLTDILEKQETKDRSNSQDPRIFFNVTAPSSTFICGSQGSGKSHTLPCLLENCLSSSKAGKLPKPLTGIVFHYDNFVSDDGGSPCEAAFLSSNPKIKVRVLCSPTNIRTIQRTYHHFDIQIEPLQISESDLNTKRILDLMAVCSDEAVPLYVHTIYRILREMRVTQQNLGGKFNYGEFKSQIMDSGLSPSQLGPLNQRLDTLESFMPKSQVEHIQTSFGPKGKGKASSAGYLNGNDWSLKSGYLTIVDLSCPCVTPESACSLFNICLSLFVEQSMVVGRVIALDEAHKFMNSSPEALTLTNTLLSVIRLQRHLGARIIISTQEPTISPALLDLCSITIAHRFTSPEWMRSLKRHLAAVAETNGSHLEVSRDDEENGDAGLYGLGKNSLGIFGDIVRLRIGEALLFAPAAIIGLNMNDDKTTETKRLSTRYLKITVRNRLTDDGGKSVMAT